jgi:membrane-associated protease RseP (regulator of RpoE activity)
MALPDSDSLTATVSRFFHVDEVTLGDPKFYLVRYRGQLLSEDTATAYDQLAEMLQPLGITPLFRIEEGRQTVTLVKSPPKPKAARVGLNVALFILTFSSVLLTGALNAHAEQMAKIYGNDIPDALLFKAAFLNPLPGLPFALALMGILLAHELGHYFAGRRNNTDVTLPYFIPLPFVSAIGTMGAVILTRQIPRNKRVLLDIGVAGPLAGLIVAIPVLILGLHFSQVKATEDTVYTRKADLPERCANTAMLGASYSCPEDDLLEGNSLLYLGLKFIIKGKLLPQPVSYDGSPVIYWLRYFLTGHPVPIGGQDVILHPVAWAGWAGLLVTFLNLIPVGQLDGGHTIYALIGKKARKLWMVIFGLLLLLGLLWWGWWLWAAIIFLFGQRHAEPLDQITPLDRKRKMVAVLVLVLFILVMTPVPFVLF